MMCHLIALGNHGINVLNWNVWPGTKWIQIWSLWLSLELESGPQLMLQNMHSSVFSLFFFFPSLSLPSFSLFLTIFLRGQFGWGEQACPLWSSLDIPLSRVHPRSSIGHQLMCEKEAAASVEFPLERKRSSHADRSGKVGEDRRQNRLWEESETKSGVLCGPTGSVSLSLTKVSS